MNGLPLAKEKEGSLYYIVSVSGAIKAEASVGAGASQHVNFRSTCAARRKIIPDETETRGGRPHLELSIPSTRLCLWLGWPQSLQLHAWGGLVPTASACLPRLGRMWVGLPSTPG